MVLGPGSKTMVEKLLNKESCVSRNSNIKMEKEKGDNCCSDSVLDLYKIIKRDLSCGCDL